MKTTALAKLISGCWTRAEQALRLVIKQELPDLDEEDVTLLLNGKLRLEFDQVSANGNVERAFLKDLQLFLPHLNDSDLSKISNGLVASVHFHPKERERKTGGDFGMVLIRPDVRQARFSQSDFTIAEIISEACFAKQKSSGVTPAGANSVRVKGKFCKKGSIIWRLCFIDTTTRTVTAGSWLLFNGN